MNKRLCACLICTVLLITGCTSKLKIENDPYPKAYVYVKEEGAGDEVNKLEWDSILASIPEDHYLEYPGLHAAPLTATLYKNDDCIEVDVKDPRLIKLLNFYHNMVYNEVYSYTQGSFSPEEYSEIANTDFKLELTYTPNWTDDSFETSFDKMLITGNAFIGVRSDTPFGEYPFSSYGRYPLYMPEVKWLEIFGF